MIDVGPVVGIGPPPAVVQVVVAGERNLLSVSEFSSDLGNLRRLFDLDANPISIDDFLRPQRELGGFVRRCDRRSRGEAAAVSTANGDKSRGSDARTAQARGGEISKWEWLAGAIGLVLVLAAVGYMVRAALQPSTPPRVVVEMDSVTVGGGGYLVHFTARNEGRTTAASVTIEGEVRDGSGAMVLSTATLDFVPAGSTRSGGRYSTRDPRGGGLELRAAGYADP